MKRILITGAGSYIGMSVEKWLMKPEFAGMYQVDTVDMRGDEWKEKDFSGYDTVFHVAGIAHMKETKENAQLYYRINRDLAIETAQNAKASNVKQFVYLSSMSIYGIESGIISEKTMPLPKTNYGKSKWQGEERIRELETDTFKVAILRPPMIYGKGCQGNYPRLSKLAEKTPIFPYTNNKRSMLFIDNMSEYIRFLIEKGKGGVFFPQNSEYVNVSQLVRKIAEMKHHKVHLIKGTDKLVLLAGGSTMKKILGTLIYDIEKDRCITVPFKESVRRTEL